MRKALALFLILVMTSSLTSAIVFADTDESQPQPDASSESSSESSSDAFPESGLESEPEPGLIAGSELIQASQIFPDMRVGDTIILAVAASCFNNFDKYDISGLSAVMPPGDAACFEQDFTRDSGAVYLRLKASAAREYGSVTLSITDGTAMSAPHTFSVVITDPPPPPVAPPSGDDEPDDIEAPVNDSGDLEEDGESSENGNPIPDSSSSSAPEASSSSSSAPEPIPSKSPSSSEAPTPEPDSSEDPAPDADTNDDSFAPSAHNMVISALFAAPNPTTITGGITGTKNGGVWQPVSGLPSGSGQPIVITPTDTMILAIPDDNFLLNPLDPNVTFENNRTRLNTPGGVYLGSVTVTTSGKNVADRFFKEFVNVGTLTSPSFGIKLTPDASLIPPGGLMLYSGTKIGFSGNPNMYSLPTDMLIVLSNSSSGTRATGISSGSQLGGQNTWVTRNGSLIGGIDVLDDAVQGDEYLIHFSPAFFEWSGSTPSKVSLSNIRGKISLRQSGTTSSRVFDSVELASVKGEAVVRVQFSKPLASIRPVDFKTKLYLTVGGRRDDDSSVEIEGTLDDVEPYEFYSEDNDIDISDGIVGIAVEHISRPRVYIGDGVTLNMLSLRKNAKFYGVASNAQNSSRDQEILELYPDILEIYTIAAIGLNGAGTTVDIDTYGNYHVYDGELNYLGNTIKKLEYSDKYYLAAKQLVLPEDEYGDDWDDWEDEPDLLDEEPPPTGGDYPGRTTPDNSYDNPATGR